MGHFQGYVHALKDAEDALLIFRNDVEEEYRAKNEGRLPSYGRDRMSWIDACIRIVNEMRPSEDD